MFNLFFLYFYVNAENGDNLVKIKNEIDKLDIIQRSTLEYLLNHLIK